MNKGLSDKLYETIFDGEPLFKESCNRIDDTVRDIVDGYSGTLQKEDAELLSDAFMDVISDAHHDGFEIGMKFAFRLITEMIMN